MAISAKSTKTNIGITWKNISVKKKEMV